MMGLSPERAAIIKEQEREQIPLKRRGNPNDVARWLVSLADPASEWVTGQVMRSMEALGSHNQSTFPFLRGCLIRTIYLFTD
jgi:NAD(P)-dependent dehydrogenase (short-subunit alcohol dehydrogenase family)